MLRTAISLIIFVVVMAVIWEFTSCTDTPYVQGLRLYNAKCANCHMTDGSGLNKLIPALELSDAMGTDRLGCIIRNGLNDTIFGKNEFLVKQMPSFPKLTENEITNIVNYMNNRWSPNFKEINILEMKEYLVDCPGTFD